MRGQQQVAGQGADHVEAVAEVVDQARDARVVHQLVARRAEAVDVGDAQRSAVAHVGPRPGHAAGRMAGHEVDGEAQAAQFDRFAVVDDAVDVHWRVEDLVAEVDIVAARSEEHTSELQSLMRISYAVFCLKKKKTKIKENNYN